MLKSGKIFFGKHGVPCAIRNLLATGACLQVQTTVGIPAVFDFSNGARSFDFPAIEQA